MALTPDGRLMHAGPIHVPIGTFVGTNEAYPDGALFLRDDQLYIAVRGVLTLLGPPEDLPDIAPSPTPSSTEPEAAGLTLWKHLVEVD